MAEEWRLCAEWLIRCQVLPSDHRVTFAGAEVFELAQTLRDGVLLCHLLNNLHPNSVDMKDFSQRPQMSQFLCLKNIRTFLQTCKGEFGLRETDLFDSYDLFDVKNFGAVIKTLSKLSKTDLAQRSGILGFPRDNRPLSTDHDYYNTLEELANDLPEEDVYSPISQDDEQDIYEDLCSVRRRMKDKDSSTSVFPEPKTKKEHCLKELIETEKNYVDALIMVVTHFIKPLKSLMTPQEHGIIFKEIEEMSSVHSAFHSELLKSIKTNNPKLSQCFLKFKKKFLIYGDYCSNLPRAQEQVDEIMKKNAGMQAKITECQLKANDGKFKLRDLLSVPMQRVLKYHLLLRELVKQTARDSEERIELEEALEAMQDLSLYVNEVKRDDENLALIQEIQGSIFDLQMPENTSLSDYGRLLKDGELKVMSHEDKKTHSRYIFLFDKVMLMCKSRGESYSYKDALVLSEFKIDEGGSAIKPKVEKQWSQQFLLVEKNQACAYTFSAKTDEMRRKWIEAVRMALDNTQPPGAKENNHDFIMYTFDTPTECDVCKKLLRGVFFQGYLCQISKKKVHKECISKVSATVNGRQSIPSIKKENLPPRPPQTRTSQVPARISGRSAIGRAKASYAYTGIPPPDNRTPLRFSENEVIDILSKQDPNWWEGRLNGMEGFFPVNYVKDMGARMARKPSYEVHFPQGAAAIPSPTSPLAPRAASPRSPNSYVNLKNLNGYKWFIGEMSRDQAMHRLETLANGTYLVRESAARKGDHALSIKFGSSVKHIKVIRQPDGSYCLADCKMFRSIPELVEYYQENTLGYSFHGLDTTLKIPYRQALEVSEGKPTGAIIGYATASYDYSATSTNQISLQRGDRITVISKAGGTKGWWKGILNGKTGYFPCAYVNEDDEFN